MKYRIYFRQKLLSLIHWFLICLAHFHVHERAMKRNSFIGWCEWIFCLPCISRDKWKWKLLDTQFREEFFRLFLNLKNKHFLLAMGENFLFIKRWCLFKYAKFAKTITTTIDREYQNENEQINCESTHTHMHKLINFPEYLLWDDYK